MAPRPDPKVKANGRCAVCDRPRPKLAVQAADPFCRTECCRHHYEVVFHCDKEERAAA